MYKMPLIHRLFNPRERKGRSGWGFRSCGRNDKNFETPESLASYKTWQAPEFEKSQIRLLVFKERDGKKLLFDSKAIKKKDHERAEKQCPRSTPCTFTTPFARLKPCINTSSAGSQENVPGAEPHGSPGTGGSNSNYTFLRPSSDVNLLGEMMFGSVAMVCRGRLLKVHNINLPPQLLLSQVFVLKPAKYSSIDQDSLDKDTISVNSVDLGMPRSSSMPSIGDMDQEPVAHSMPVAVPQSPYKNRDDNNSPGASASSNSFLTPFPSPLSNGGGTPNSFHKRWLRNQMTSMEHGVVRRHSSDAIEEPIARRERNPKISVGILISLFEEGETEKLQKFQSFFFSHFNLIEGHFCKLSSAIENALMYQRRNYVHPIVQALKEFRSSVHALYTAPRIQKPIWLNMMTFPLQRNHLCEHLMKELMLVLEMYNNRQTNFFLSRLLTGVLTHHLAWVPTVMPAGATPSRAYLDKHSSTTLDWLAKSHPYNPLWAQLGDMYGAVGYPNKVAKTVVVGKKADLVCRILYILTYFIRCSEVQESHEKREEVVMEFKEESGYYSDISKDADEPFSILEPTHTLEPCLATVEETAETLVSPSESSSQVMMDRRLTLTSNSSRTEASTPEDGELTPVALSPAHPIRCKDDVVMNVKREVVAPVGKAPADQQEQTAVCVKLLDAAPLERKRDFVLPLGQAAEPLIRCKNDIVFESKKECVTNVGRSCDTSNNSLFSASRSNKNTNLLVNKYSSEQSNATDEAYISNVGNNSHFHNMCEHQTDKICNSQTLKLFPSLCNSTERVENNIETGGRTSLDSKEARDLYGYSDAKSEVSTPTQTGEIVNFLRSLSSASTTSSVFSSEPDYPNDLWMGVNKGSEVIADIHPAKHHSRCVSSTRTLSTTSSLLSFDTDGTLTPDHEELPLAFSELILSEVETRSSYIDNFGRSLLGGLSQKYVPEMALHGVSELDLHNAVSELEFSVQNSVLDEAITETICVVANTDKWTVELLSSERPAPTAEKPLAQEVACSDSVSELLDSVQQLWNMRMPPDFCLMHLEDCLQQLYFKSTLMAAYLDKNPTSCHKDLSVSLGVETSDIPLLLGVTSVHAPQVIMNVLSETFDKQPVAMQ